MKHSNIIGIAVTLLAAVSTQAATFDVGGLAGTGVTANVMFGYSADTATTGIITISITNTTIDSGSTAGAFITAFAFNVPTSGFTITSIASDVDDPDGSQVVTALISPNESGWYARYDGNNISTPNTAGDFDFGVMNSNSVNAFITDGTGGSSKILIGNTTTFTLAVAGSGLTGMTESDFLSLLSVGGNAGAFNFAVRFQGIGLNDDSDLAVTTRPVPLPGAVVLCAFGLCGVGAARSRRKTR